MSIIRNFSITGTANTAVALKDPVNAQANRTPAAWAVIQAAKGNTGSVYVGGTPAPTNGTTTTNTVELAKGDSLTLPAMGIADSYDLSTVFMNVDTNGDKVRVVYGRA